MNKFLIFIILFAVILFGLHYVEIFEILERNCYFSDSENYYKAAIKFPPDSYDAYYFVFILSFLNLFIPYNLSLCLLFFLYTYLIISFYKAFKLDKINCIFLFHPFIIFFFIRGLKESIIVIALLLFFRLFNERKFLNILNIITIIIFSLLLDGLKPMGLYILPLCYIITRVFEKKIKSKSYLFIGTIFLLITPLIRNLSMELIPFIKNHIDVLELSGYPVEYTNIFFKPLVAFFFGPGPLKSFSSFFSSVYEFSTFMTSLNLFLGSLFSIILFFLICTNYKTIVNNKINSFIIICTVIHIVSYILIQDGSVDTRQRGLMFFYLGLIRWK